jgi:hypothetical protein
VPPIFFTSCREIKPYLASAFAKQLIKKIGTPIRRKSGRKSDP